MAMALLFTLLAGCVSSRPESVALLPPATLPVYGIGDTYQFSDGSRETVVATSTDQVWWHSNHGSFITSRDALLPPVAWTDPDETGERRIGAGGVLLFPLQANGSVTFTATRMVRTAGRAAPVTTQESWRCGVTGAAPVQTPAGRFNTWRVDCTMSEQPSVSGVGLVQRTFYYDPGIGYYVRREERIGDGPTRAVELSRFVSGEPALSQNGLQLRLASIQQALERQPSGDGTAWNDSATGDRGEVRLVRTMHSDRLGWCRDFTENIHVGGRAYSLSGTGCRNQGGQWDVVALAPASAGNT